MKLFNFASVLHHSLKPTVWTPSNSVHALVPAAGSFRCTPLHVALLRWVLFAYVPQNPNFPWCAVQLDRLWLFGVLTPVLSLNSNIPHEAAVESSNNNMMSVQKSAGHAAVTILE